MIGNLTKNWWAFALQGVLAIGLGVAAFVVPGPTLAALIAVFAAYAIVSGILGIVAGFSVPNGPRWALVLGGAAGVAVGVFTFAQPQTTAIALVILVGIYAIATGVAQLAAAGMLRPITNTFLLGLSGVLSVVFGVLLISAPGDGALAVLWVIGFYAIFAGVSLLGFAFRVRGLGKDLDDVKAKVTSAAGGTTTGTTGTTGPTTGTTGTTAPGTTNAG